MDKKKIILATALSLFVENGFHGTATGKIALDSGVANGTLFNYFKTKDELIVTLYQTVLSEMESFIFESLDSHSISKESFRSLFVETVSWSMKNPIQFQYIQQFRHSPYYQMVNASPLKQAENPLFVLIQKGIDLVLIKQMSVSFIYSLFTSQINGLCDYIISSDLNNEEHLKLINETFEMLWKMIKD